MNLQDTSSFFSKQQKFKNKLSGRTFHLDIYIKQCQYPKQVLKTKREIIDKQKKSLSVMWIKKNSSDLDKKEGMMHLIQTFLTKKANSYQYF